MTDTEIKFNLISQLLHQKDYEDTTEQVIATAEKYAAFINGTQAPAAAAVEVTDTPAPVAGASEGVVA